MAGTIVVDRIESDASYASNINVASQITFSNTVNFGITSVVPVAGFYSPSTNNVAFTTASTERMRIIPSGNVLIGTTTTQTGAVLAVTGGIQGTITSGTTVASTSGTTIDFTAIPSWVKRITVMLAGVSFTAGNNLGIQLGVGGVAVTTGYSSVTQFSQTGNAPTVSAYATSIVSGAGFSASVLYNGIVTIAYMGSNKWVASSILNSDGSVAQATSSGYIALSGVLDMVRVMGGTFDAGSINILFEG